MKGVMYIYLDKVFQTIKAIRIQGEREEWCIRGVSWDCKSHQNLCYRIECDCMSQTEASQVFQAIKIMARAGWEVTGVLHVQHSGPSAQCVSRGTLSNLS